MTWQGAMPSFLVDGVTGQLVESDPLSGTNWTHHYLVGAAAPTTRRRRLWISQVSRTWVRLWWTPYAPSRPRFRCWPWAGWRCFAVANSRAAKRTIRKPSLGPSARGLVRYWLVGQRRRIGRVVDGGRQPCARDGGEFEVAGSRATPNDRRVGCLFSCLLSITRYTIIMAGEMRFSDVRQLLEAKGYRLDRIKGRITYSRGPVAGRASCRSTGER